MRFLWKLLRVEWALFKISAINDLQMRLNLFMQFLNDSLWYAVQIILFESIYMHVDQLGGWTLAETRVFLGMLFLVDGLQMVLFAYNFDFFSDKVARGELDLLLLKPVSAQQLFTSQRMQCGYLLNVLLALTWLLWSLTSLPGGFPWNRAWMLLLVVPAASSIFYSMRLIFNLPALLFTHAGYLQDFYFYLFRLGQRPDRLYGPGLRYLILMVVPVAMIASVPTRVLVDPFDAKLLVGLIAAAAISLFLANRLWHLGLRRYTSASS